MHSVDTVTQEINTITTTLSECVLLSPSPVVNTALTKLVDIVLTTPPSLAIEVLATLPQSTIASLQTIAMNAEAALEHVTVNQFLANPKLNWQDIKKFQYYQCYAELTALEMERVDHAARSTAVLFVGGGPLPLSAMIMAHDYNQLVTVIDRDVDAVRRSRALVERLGLSHLVIIEHADIFEYQSTERVIILAAMVGQTAIEKARLAEYLSISAQADVRVLARGVTGLAELLYLPQRPNQCWYEVQSITRQTIINTVHVWQKLV